MSIKRTLFIQTNAYGLFFSCNIQKCFSYCFQQLREKHIPFCLLLPQYVVARQYYQDELNKKLSSSDSVFSMIYFLPYNTYRYDHPEGTGKADCPFESIWLIGAPKCNGDELAKLSLNGTLITSWEKLREELGCFRKRPNPRQRRKRRHQREQEHDNDSIAVVTTSQSSSSNPEKQTNSRNLLKQSKYRDSTGRRKKHRF